ncbi:MAG TPA: pyridoxamine 5'-phosphate oxidase family protein [Acidimicrobiales bacterium]|nr:pyridoxamine 5'-phosphate oxidase family protein [Acidimicrobiales bacterium]
MVDNPRKMRNGPAVPYSLTREAGPGEQKALNLRANDQCALTTGDNRWKVGLDVVVEGRAARVTDDALLRVLAAMWATKYDGDWQYDVRDGAFHHEPGVVHVFEVRPCKLSFAKGRLCPDPVPFRRLTRGMLGSVPRRVAQTRAPQRPAGVDLEASSNAGSAAR